MSSSLRLSPSHQCLPIGLLLLLLPSPASSTHSFASRRLLVRLPAGHPPRRCSVAAQALDPAALLERCGGDAAKLARQLSKEQLKTLCASHGLAVGGTKADLAPRLLAALQQPAAPAVQAAPAVRAAPRRATQLPPRVKGGEGGPAGSSPPPLREKAAVAEALPSQSTGCDWELTVLGSGSCNPTPWRGASCNALRVKDSIWLFDVGEGTQVQMQRCMIKASLIDRIFITHAHGDHCFGLPGLLCLISRGRRADAPPLEIYGPQGLRNFVRMSVRFTRTRMLPAYVVHELHGIPSERGRHPGGMEIEPEPWGGTTRAGAAWGEQPGGRDLSPEDTRRWWTLFDDAELGVRVSAAPVRHTVPCVGYVVKEADQPGRLLPEKVMPHLQANARAIRDSMGVRDPRALLKQIKQLGADEVFELPDGTRLVGREVIGQPRRGRKVVLLGDCSDASPADFLGGGADVLLHEATNAYLPWFGDRGGAHELERTTISHGHSTPQMAGLAARRMGARALLLSHFSQRYHPAALGVMRAIKKLAVDSSQLGEDCVATAYDALTIPLWQTDKGRKPFEIEQEPPLEQHPTAGYLPETFDSIEQTQ